jgi:hypothetical protein
MQLHPYARVHALRVGLRIVGTLLKPDRSDARIGPGKGPQHHRSYHAYEIPASRLAVAIARPSSGLHLTEPLADALRHAVAKRFEGLASVCARQVQVGRRAFERVRYIPSSFVVTP